MANELIIYQSVIDDVKSIISSGMESAYNATSRVMVLTYWNVGRRIVEQEQSGNQRAEYGAAMMGIVNSCVHNLTGTHFRSLLRVADEDIARYSVLHDNNRLFMSKYLTYLPTKEQLKQEIERQKAVFYMQHPIQIEEGGDAE